MNARSLSTVFMLTIAPMTAIAQQSGAFDVAAVIKKIDADNGTVAFTSGGVERTVKTVKDVKVLDRDGKSLAAGLGAKELAAGAEATIAIERRDNKPFIQAIRLGKKNAAPPQAKKDDLPPPKQDTSMLKPLTDMGHEKYQGFAGGLYPNGKNERPANHEGVGLALAKRIEPLDAAGKPSKDGKIVLLGIGFSNTVQAFNGFMQVAKKESGLNPHLVLVNGAMGGMSANMIQDPDKGRGVKYWAGTDEQLKAAGVTRAQVEVIWLKETNPGPHAGAFPKYIRDLQSELTRVVQLLPKRYPNLKLVYLSSRTYGGWAKAPPERKGGPGNSEPYSYETGFAVKWLIEQQLMGDTELNFDAKQGEVKAPWLSWGPYLWANGDVPRKDGYRFDYDDFTEKDRMHHSLQGQQKVGRQLLQFFKTDSTTHGWFVK